MKNKQIVGMVVAVVLFIITCAASMGMNIFEKYVMNAGKSEVPIFGGEAVLPVGGEYVAKLIISGEMSDAVSTGYFSTDTITYNHEYLIDYVDQLISDSNNVGMLMYVNSPGGYVYMADELYNKLVEYKGTGRPIYCYFDKMAASGAYYASMAADEIYGNRMTTTGSIGVIMSTYNLSGLFEKYGIQEVVIKSAANKGIGSIGTEWTEEQLAIEQAIVDEYYGYFIDAIEAGRGMERSEIIKLADGRSYTGTQALNNGLIDGLMDYDDYEAQEAENPFAALMSSIQKSTPKSDMQMLKEMSETMESGVPKYESTY